MRENGVATLVGPKCTLSLGGPLIIYPYWTQFTLKLTGSRLVSLAKLTSKLTIYDRSLAHLLCPFIRSFSRLVLLIWTLFWRASGSHDVEFIRMPSHSRSRLVTHQEICLLNYKNHNTINSYCDKCVYAYKCIIAINVILNYNVSCDFSNISYLNDRILKTFYC